MLNILVAQWTLQRLLSTGKLTLFQKTPTKNLPERNLENQKCKAALFVYEMSVTVWQVRREFGEELAPGADLW